ncbi:MAG: hypothetical protein J7M21_01760, partial [Planctomycetes bacterium]|nr:hypothetical protein [Planctomycetota bacterium]
RITAAGRMDGSGDGRLSVAAGKVLTYYGGSLGEHAVVTVSGGGTTLAWRGGDSAGRVDVSAGGRLLLDELTYEITSTGEIDVSDATFSLPGPSSFPYHWTGQFFTNDGTIRLDDANMVFGVYPNFHGYAIGPVLKGSGDLEVTNGSRLVDPRISAEGTVRVDAASKVEMTEGASGTVSNLKLAGRLHLHGDSRLAFLGTWDVAAGAVLTDEGSTRPNTLSIMGEWRNRMIDPADFDLTNTLVEMVGGTEAEPLLLEVTSADLGNVPDGWEDNFALPALTIKAGGYLYLVDRYANAGGELPLPSGSAGEALYVDRLTLESGAILNTGDLNVYYKTLSGDPGQIIHQYLPEPSLLLLLAAGGLALPGYRPRGRRRRAS